MINLRSVERDQRLTAATIGMLALAVPTAVAGVALAGVANPHLLSRVPFDLTTLNALATALGWARLLAAALLAIPVASAR